MPTHILQTEKITPPKGKLVYNITCSLSVTGCSQISGEIGDAATAAGEQFQRCDAGATPTQADGCFTNAVNAKAAVIVVNAVGTNQAGVGYRAAAAAGIPIVGVFTGNPPGAPGVRSEVAGTACPDEARLVADYIMVQTNGHANTLFASDKTLSCDTQRTSAFDSEMKKCSTCKVTNVFFNYSSLTSDLPQKITTALTANPNVNYIVGVFDQVAKISATAAQQSGHTSLHVAGMDANPPNLQDIAAGGLQNVDITVGQGEVAWAGVYTALRVLSGQSVPAVTPVNYWIIDRSNISQVPSGGFLGPAGYQQQFEALWS
jgi:ABC-type sugar transport system substrate-binding protein